MTLARRLTGLARGAGFDPSSILGLQAWYEIDSIVASDDDLITTWSDSSGNSRTLTRAANDTHRPTYKTGQVNGLACLRFDGLDDGMGSTSFTVAQPLTTIMVVKPVAWTNADWLWDSKDASEAGAVMLGSTPEIQLWAGSAFVATNSDLTVGSWHVLVSILNGASSSLRVDGGTPTTGNPGTVGIANGFNLAAKANDSSTSQIDVPEVLIYDSALSDGDRNALETYLGAKYGITVA